MIYFHKPNYFYIYYFQSNKATHVIEINRSKNSNTYTTHVPHNNIHTFIQRKHLFPYISVDLQAVVRVCSNLALFYCLQSYCVNDTIGLLTFSFYFLSVNKQRISIVGFVRYETVEHNFYRLVLVEGHLLYGTHNITGEIGCTVIFHVNFYLPHFKINGVMIIYILLDN